MTHTQVYIQYLRVYCNLNDFPIIYITRSIFIKGHTITRYLGHMCHRNFNTYCKALIIKIYSNMSTGEWNRLRTLLCNEQDMHAHFSYAFIQYNQKLWSLMGQNFLSCWATAYDITHIRQVALHTNDTLILIASDCRTIIMQVDRFHCSYSL